MKTETVNRTLQLFWKTVEACDIDLKEAEKILDEIERKHGVRTSDLERDCGISLKKKKSAELKKKEIRLTKEELRFLENFKGNKDVNSKNYKRTIGIGLTTLYKALKTGKMNRRAYESFVKTINKNRVRSRLCP